MVRSAIPKSALTARAWLMVTTQVEVPEQPEPLQPRKVEPLAAEAVSVTTVPSSYVSEQVEPQATAAAFTLGEVALAPTETVTVIAGYDALDASTLERVQVGSEEQSQPVPLIPVTVSPAGGASVTVTVEPSVGPSPELLTVSV